MIIVMKKIMENTGNMKNWQIVMEFCDPSWNFTDFALKLTKFVEG